MTVVMKGGLKGGREDGLPNISVSYDKQVPQNTAKNISYTDVQYTQNSGNREGDATPPMPNCGTPDPSAV